MKKQTLSSARNDRAAQHHEDESTFSFSKAALYADKDELIEKNVTFTIDSITHQEGRGYEGGDRWSITVSMEGRADEIITLGCNEKRDAELRAALGYLEKHGPIRDVRLKKSGNTYFLETVAKSLK